jgi:zinc transport system substrate-binding protein
MAMRTVTRTIGVAWAVMAMLACGAGAPEEAPVEPTAGTVEIGTVEVSNAPLAWVVERLAAPLVDVRFRAADVPDPAYWEPTPDDVLEMQQADLVVLNGASYEGWLTNVSLPTSRVVDTSAAVAERLIRIEDVVTHSHGPEGEHEHTGTAFTTWLDPTLLAEQARAVRTALGLRWPEHDGLFADRLVALETDLEALDAELEAAVAWVGDRPLVFSHPVYQYLQQRYGLVGDSVHWEPDATPDDAQWRELAHVQDHHPARWMVWEAEPLPEVAEALAERGIGVIVVSPCATPPAEGTFLDVMRQNAARLREAGVVDAGAN